MFLQPTDRTAMVVYTDLETCATELTAAAKSLGAETLSTNHSTWGLSCSSGQSSSNAGPSSLIPPNASENVRQAQRTIMANASKIQMMLSQPADFLQRLVLNNQLLACLQWLCEFQVLTCIPLEGSVPFKDVAEIIGVPDTQLCQVARMMASVGFLHEPQPGHIAHSALSAPFVTNAGLHDAAVFASERAAPSALKMSQATKQFPGSDQPEQSAFNLAFNHSIPLASCFDQRPKLQRQFNAYLSYSTNCDDAGIQDVLMRLDWRSLGNATVVDLQLSGQSTALAIALARLFLSLRFVVQTSDSPLSHHGSRSSVSSNGSRLFSSLGTGSRSTYPKPIEVPSELSSRITLQQHIPNSQQSVRNAAVYIVRLPSPSPILPLSSIISRATTELSAHLDVLRANPDSRLLVVAPIVPAPGTVDHDTEAAARLRDLSLQQLTNRREFELTEVVELLKRVRDGTGGIALTNEIHSPTSRIVAFEVKYQEAD